MAYRSSYRGRGRRRGFTGRRRSSRSRGRRRSGYTVARGGIRL